MNRMTPGVSGLAALTVLALLVTGCPRGGIRVLVPPLASLRQVPVSAVLEGARLNKATFMLDAETNRYQQVGQSGGPGWIYAERFDELCLDYLAKAQLFQDVGSEPPRGRTESYLVFRPRVTVKQYVRPSVSGTVLTFGTGLIYNILGGSDLYRYVDCELAVDVQGPSGRGVGTYTSSCRSAERLVTDGAGQLGPLVSYAFTKVLEDFASQVSMDNDLLMRALSADMTAKGVLPIADSPMRIHVRYPKGLVLRSQRAQIAGQVIGIDRPVALEWSLNGSRLAAVPLTPTAAGSVQEFAFQAPLVEGVCRIALSLRGQGEGASSKSELARTELAYLCLPENRPLPEVRQRWAVVIGISDYAHAGTSFPSLKFGARDAQAFSEFLCSPRSGGFSRDHVLCLLDKDATAANIRYALFEFLARAAKDDLIVRFFSGHGMPQPGTENFFVLCHDTLPERLASTAFPMWDIETALKRFVKAQRVVVLADACHAGVISSPDGAKGAGDNAVHQYLQQLALSEPGRLIFTASEARELSYESNQWGGGHGAFTYFLLEGLNGKADADGNGVVTTGELVEYVRAGVMAATGGKQHPDPSGQYDRKLPLAVVEGK